MTIAVETPSWEDTIGSDPPRADGVDHVHQHEHDHDGDHVHEGEGHVHSEAKPPTTPSRAVMIDVGDTKGALVLNARSELEGIEVEIHPVSEPTKKTHVWVLPREGRDGLLYAAVFPSLAIGEYAVLRRDGTVAFVVDVPANKVTYATWD
jgi:hypothetical protein